MSDDVLGQMDRRRFLAAGSALSVGVLSGWACGPADSGSEGRGRSGGGADDDELPPRVVGLRSLGGAFRFDPEGLHIEPGDELHWLNMGDFHTVTAFHPDNAALIPNPVPLRMPEAAASFHSGMLGLTAGTQFTHRFDVEGVYDYFCQPHYSFGMVGRVIVGEILDGPALNRPDDDLIEVARANIPSVESIVGSGGVLFEWAARVNGVLYRMANGGDPASAAEAVAEGAAADAVLRDQLGKEGWATFEDAVSAMVDEATGAADYEVLVQRADAVKKGLR